MKKKILVGISVLVIILVAILIVKKVTVGTNKDALNFKKDYESVNGEKNSSGKEYRVVNIPKNNPFVYKTEDEIVKMMENKQTFVVYFGFNTCPWCRSVIEELIKVSKDMGIKTIYYVNIRPDGNDIRDTINVNDDGTYEKTKEGTSGYYKLLQLMDKVLSDYGRTDSEGNPINVNEKRIYAPNVVAVVNGKAVKLDTGISSDQSDAYMELTGQMKKDSYNQFKDVLSQTQLECNQKEAC